MPIYEYRAAFTTNCDLCKNKFEVKQGMDEDPLVECPRCGAEVYRLISRSFISIVSPLSQKETFETYTAEEADSLRLEEGFAEDQIWD